MVDAIFHDRLCDIVCGREKLFCAVPHGDAKTGVFQHGKVVGAVANGNRVFVRDLKIFFQKLNASGFGKALRHNLIKTVFAVDERERATVFCVKSVKITFWMKADTEFVKYKIICLLWRNDLYCVGDQTGMFLLECADQCFIGL